MFPWELGTPEHRTGIKKGISSIQSQIIWCTYILWPYFSQWGISPRESWRKLHPRKRCSHRTWPNYTPTCPFLICSASVLQWSWCWPEPWWSQQTYWQDLDFSSLSWVWTVWNSFQMSHLSSCASAWCLELPCSLQVFLDCSPLCRHPSGKRRFNTFPYFGDTSWWFSRGQTPRKDVYLLCLCSVASRTLCLPLATNSWVYLFLSHLLDRFLGCWGDWLPLTVDLLWGSQRCWIGQRGRTARGLEMPWHPDSVPGSATDCVALGKSLSPKSFQLICNKRVITQLSFSGDKYFTDWDALLLQPVEEF